MKKTFANLVQKSLMVALLVAGALLFGASSAEAQSSTQSLGGNWVDAGEAQNRLIAELDLLKNDPSIHSVGTDNYIRVHYFKTVYRLIDAGINVPKAVIDGLGPINPATDSRPATIPGVSMSQGQRDSHMNYLVSRLTQ